MRATEPGRPLTPSCDDVAPSSHDQPRWTPDAGPMPALFLSHGAPPLFDDPLWISELFAWSQALPKPTAILMVSAHWEACPAAHLGHRCRGPAGLRLRRFRPALLLHDLSDPGRISAWPPGSAALMPDDEPVHQDSARGLDHGAWVPLKVMYPYADVPVLQLSIPTHDPARLLELGRRLRPLARRGRAHRRLRAS